jgi:catechol 2,3-dioxygenase-like lactoylglutathione lyase family enzyme
MPKNTEFELGGINHLALVSSDMKRTIDFYSGVLGMPLIKTIDLPGTMGQHFFFDCGGGDCVAFFWFPDAPDGVPGVSAPKTRPEQGELVSAVGSMNHVAFHVPPEKFDEYLERLAAKGVEVSPVLNHDDSPSTVAERLHPGVFVRSFYFQDPDGILLEFACWTRTFDSSDVSHAPKTGADRTVPATAAAAAAAAARETHASLA